MAVQSSEKSYVTFVKGLNTEGAFFTIPPNTWTEGDNVYPNVDGSIQIRNGIHLETGNIPIPFIHTVDNEAFYIGKWTAVGGDGTIDAFVVQVGAQINLYKAEGGTVSTNYFGAFSAAYLDLRTIAISPTLVNSISTIPVKIASANGGCVLTHPYCEPIYIKYDIASNTFSVATLIIKIRDFDGDTETLAVDERPTTLSASHQYNLENQGWTSAQWATYYSTGSYNKYPSNAESWIYGKTVDDDFDAALLRKQDFGTTKAPRGRKIVSPFSITRPATSVYANRRPSVCAFFAGRAWFAGMSTTSYSGTIFFSQVATSADNLQKCYQQNDPTSEHLSDLLDNDGGTINIQEAGDIVDVVPYGYGVLVLASNGVWQITGTANNGFSATSFEVNKISSYGALSHLNTVVAGDKIFYWSKSGICVIQQTDRGVSVTNITDDTIKTLYTSISGTSKLHAAGGYNESKQQIVWCYSGSNVSTDAILKDKQLYYDLRLGAFYTYTISADGEPSSMVLYPCVTNDFATTTTIISVVVGTDEVFVDTEPVGAIDYAIASGETQFKFLSRYWTGTEFAYTFADFIRTENAPDKFMDWAIATMTARILTGHQIEPNGPSKSKVAQYVTVYMKNTETDVVTNESQCMMRTRWEFSDSSNSNKWSAEQQVYRHTRPLQNTTTNYASAGFPLVITKNKIRGYGRAMQIEFSSVPGYDMRIVGWTATMIGGTNV